MLIILSQKVDSESSYSDELFNSYHYPARYRNQIHKGDTFVYYQGNRYDKSQRYYFGIGTVGEILTTDGENYYAKLIDCQRFEKNVPIYLPDGGYIEQLGYETIRNSINPPWQSSVRPISQQAYDYILNAAGIQLQARSELSLEELKNRLMKAVKDFYVEKDDSAVIRIENIAKTISKHINSAGNADDSVVFSPVISEIPSDVTVHIKQIDSSLPLDRLVDIHSQVIKELKKRKIISGRIVLQQRQTREIGMSLVFHYYKNTPNLPNLYPPEKRQRSFNAISLSGLRYCIVVLPTNLKRVISGRLDMEENEILEITNKKFDYLVVCKFDDNCCLKGIYEFAWDIFYKHMNYIISKKWWTIKLTNDIISEARIICEARNIDEK